MKKLLDKKVLGDVKLVRARQNFFARRYDWQTLLYREGGAMRNNAAHTIEQIMDLAGSDGDLEVRGRRGGLHVRHHEVFQRHCVRGGGQPL